MSFENVMTSINGHAVSLKYIGLILLDCTLECYFRGVAIVLRQSTAGYSPVVGLMPQSCFGHQLMCTVSSGRGDPLPFDAGSLRGYVSCADRIVLARLRLLDVFGSLASPLGRSVPARFGFCNANLTFFLEPAAGSQRFPHMLTSLAGSSSVQQTWKDVPSEF